MVRNVHERIIHTSSLSQVGGLIDQLASRNDLLWPSERWPPMRFDRPLGVGATGGHGPIRYTVEDYEPGRSIRFRFTAPRGFDGTHALEVEEIELGKVRLRHTLVMQLKGAARLSWPLMFRWLHDALIEDALDCAESYAASVPLKQREFSLRVKILRRLARPAAQQKKKAASRTHEQFISHQPNVKTNLKR
jgi:hypothetical protein